MFKCERCGSGYNANHIGVENCPRCLLLDRVQSPLSFQMFKISGGATRAPEGERAVEPEQVAEVQRVPSAR